MKSRDLFFHRLALLFKLACITLAGFCFQANAETRADSTFGITNFAFASYLGTGFYSTSGQEVFVFQMPFEHVIKEETDEEAGWALNLPITIGFINFSSVDIENLPELDDVGTLTFLPGIEYRKKIYSNWTLIPFADYGFARDFNHTHNVLIIGAGIKSYAHFDLPGSVFTLGNRLLYARESNEDVDINSDYTLIETGLNFRLNSQTNIGKKNLKANFYYVNYYYPNNLVFFERTTSPIRVGMENEFGFTLSNFPDFLFFSDVQLGFGIRFGNDLRVYRLLFSAPF